MTILAGSRIGSYEVLSPLGAGGMGEVYRAHDARLGRDVALKVLPQEVSRDRDRLARFEQEARSASALNHPNIVTIYEVGESDGTSFIAMELIDGKTLRELVADEPLPIRKVLAYGAQTAEGLARAHAAGIVHRDLKPENLMVTKDGFVKILDFGLSKLVTPESGGVSAMPTLAKPETQPGTVLGTVAYMSPEQASGRPVDYRSDQFSLGAILYEALAGQKAFQKDTAAETMSAIIREEPEPLAKLRPDSPLPLRWLVERCLTKDPEERYASTRDLARDLASIRDHISEISSGAQQLLAAPVRGRRLSPWLAAAGILLLGALAGALLAPGLGRKAPSSTPSFHRLTFRQGIIQNARFAPDGQTILYGATWAGEPGRLYLTRPESPESRPFDFGNDRADILAVSPSGEMAILLNETNNGVLARVPMAGGVPRQVLERVSYAGADFAPNGKDLVVAHRVEGRVRIEFPIGKPIVDEPASGLGSPRFSPRGDRIAFFAGNEVAVTDSAGKGKRVLSSGWTALQGVPCWRPDGQEIWFTGGEAGQSNALYAVDLSGKRRLVTRVPGSLELDDISKDGRVLVAHHTIANVLRGVAVWQGRERDLSWLDGSVPADLSPDGKTLVFTEAGEGSGAAPAVYLRKTDGSPAVRLGEGSGLALSPDGQWVLARVNPGGGKPERLVLLPTGPGETRTLKTEEFVRYVWGSWLPDGKRVVLAAEEKGRGLRAYVQDLEGGKARPFTPEFGSGAGGALSSDGKLLAAGGGGRPVRIYPVDGGDPRPVAGLEAGEIPVQWSADGHSLYVHLRFGNPNKVWLVDPDTGQRRLWLEIKLDESAVRAVPYLLMSRDGKSYAYGALRATSELYLVEGLK